MTEVISKWFPGQISGEKFIIITGWSEDGGWLIEKIEWNNKSINPANLNSFEKTVTHYFNNLPKVGTFSADL
jgi:hypothetical protein